jgi:hypothetical protein
VDASVKLDKTVDNVLISSNPFLPTARRPQTSVYSRCFPKQPGEYCVCRRFCAFLFADWALCAFGCY